MSTRLIALSTAQVGITPPVPLSSLVLAVKSMPDGTAVDLGQPTNPSGDGLTWTFDPQSSSVPADLIGVMLELTWTETALVGGQVFTAVEYVIPEQGLVGRGPKYTTLGSLKLYGRGASQPGSTQQVSNDDPMMLEAIYRAEEAIDCYCGSRFEYSANVDEVSSACFVDQWGWLVVQLFQPILSVQSISIMDRRTRIWADVTFDDLLLDPTVARGDPPLLASYRLRGTPSARLSPGPQGRYVVKATYEGGYTTIPGAMQGVCDRTAWWYYKVREVPMGTVRDLSNNTVTIPQDFPADIKGQMAGWKRLPL